MFKFDLFYCMPFPHPWESIFFIFTFIRNAFHLLLFMFISQFQKFLISNVNLICCKSLFCCSLPSLARELFVFYRPNNTTLQTTWSHHSKIRQILENKHCQRHNRSKALRKMTHWTPLVQSRILNKLWNLGQTSAWFCLTRARNT